MSSEPLWKIFSTPATSTKTLLPALLMVQIGNCRLVIGNSSSGSRRLFFDRHASRQALRPLGNDFFPGSQSCADNRFGSGCASDRDCASLGPAFLHNQNDIVAILLFY